MVDGLRNIAKAILLLLLCALVMFAPWGVLIAHLDHGPMYPSDAPADLTGYPNRK